MTLGADKNTAEKDIADVNDLLTAITILRTAQRSGTITPEKITPMNLKTLKNMYSDVDWIKLFNNFVIRTQTTPSITENTMLKFLKKDSFQKLMALLKSTNPRVVANLVALDVLANGIQAILPGQPPIFY